MAHFKTHKSYSHIKYEWNDEMGSYCCIILHMLGSFKKWYPHVEQYRTIPMTYHYDCNDVLHWQEVRT